MTTDLTDIATPALTVEDAEELAGRHRLAVAEAARLRTNAMSKLEMASFWDDVADVIGRRLNGPVSLLLPSAAVEQPAEPRQELPVEAEAHQAAAEQVKAGREPYGPSTVPDLPQFNTGHVQVPGEFPSTDLRITTPGWTNPAMQNGAVR